MDEIVRRAVERAIVTMEEKLGEPLTIDDIARSASFSKFHFSRLFQKATGVSPGRFLSALRLAEAKKLLLSTTITVTDISHRVGYNSVGTFSTRFTAIVGISPAAYRRRRGSGPVSASPDRHTGSRGTILRGTVHAPPGGVRGAVFVGLFPSRITEGRPVRHVVLDAPGAYVLHDVPDGTWHLVAHCEDDTGHLAHHGPVTTRSEVTATLVDLRLRPVRMFDPPVLLALPARHWVKVAV
jgi:AraC family transcriptional regulator